MTEHDASFAALEKREKDERSAARREADRLRTKRFTTEVQRAIAAGFTERQAPYAVTIRLLRGECSVGELRAHMKATKPWLFEDLPDPLASLQIEGPG